MKTALLTALVSAMMFGTFAVADDKPATTQPAPIVNTKCPISGEDVDKSVTPAVYEGKSYGFCCSDCIKKFQADPKKYAAAAK